MFFLSAAVKIVFLLQEKLLFILEEAAVLFLCVIGYFKGDDQKKVRKFSIQILQQFYDAS